MDFQVESAGLGITVCGLGLQALVKTLALLTTAMVFATVLLSTSAVGVVFRV